MQTDGYLPISSSPLYLKGLLFWGCGTSAMARRDSDSGNVMDEEELGLAGCPALAQREETQQLPSLLFLIC